MKYFLVPDAVYEATRSELDAVFNHPIHGPDGRVVTESCLRPASHPDNIRHADGRIAVAVPPEWLKLKGVPETLEQLVTDGLVEEITEKAFELLLTSLQPP